MCIGYIKNRYINVKSNNDSNITLALDYVNENELVINITNNSNQSYTLYPNNFIVFNNTNICTYKKCNNMPFPLISNGIVEPNSTVRYSVFNFKGTAKNLKRNKTYILLQRIGSIDKDNYYKLEFKY